LFRKRLSLILIFCNYLRRLNNVDCSKSLSLKQKLWTVVLASFVARLIAFFALPNTPSSLGPDEGTYAALTKWIGESKPAVEFPAYGQGLYLSGRSIISPASILYRAGIHELDAVRLVSTTYGLCSLILLVLVTMRIQNHIAKQFSEVKFNENLILSLIFIFTFLPSHFVWSNLGLRESATEFWLISTFVVFFIIFQYRKKITFPTLLMLFGSIVLTFSARPQVGWVLGVSLSLYLLLNLKKPSAFFLLPLVLCATLFSSTLNLGTLGTPGTALGGAFRPLLTAGEVVTYKQEVNQLDAASVIKTQSCPRETPSLAAVPPTEFDTYFCIVWRAPYMVSTFLLRPILGVDVTSTSSFIAAVENIFWLFLLITIIVLVIRRRSVSFLAPILPALIFFVLYVVGASAYQGNMGTGFRHKSLILWAVLLLIFALTWRKTEKPEQSLRKNSQESAV
jgi:hypothetical protein